MNFRAEIRAGDEEAFGKLFDDFARSVYNHAFRLTGDWSTAEDVMSLTFLEAWRLRAKVDPEGESLRPWLLGIATNVARNTTRASRRHAAMAARLPAPIDQADFSDEVAGRLDDAQQLAAIRSALGRLRRCEQEVFTLCVWAGLDYATAANALGIPVGTVRSRLSRARKKLANALADPIPVKPEPADRSGQVLGDCGTAAVRPSQEIPR
jgi:RNA polymerase sigma-70 factor (ECF subfamily)